MWLATQATSLSASTLAGHAGEGAGEAAGGRFEQGDLAALPLPDASVDAALCALALVHVPDLHPALAELARVVRPGGRIVISDVHPFLVALGWQAQFRTADGATGFVRLNRHLPSNYVRAARSAGLAVRGMAEPLLPPGSAVTVRPGPDPGGQRGRLGGAARGDCPRFDAVS